MENRTKFIQYMKIFLILSFCFIFLAPSSVPAEEKKETVKLDALGIETGLIIPGYSGYQGRIGEYTIFDRGLRPIWGFEGVGTIDGTYFRLEGFYEDEKDQTYAADIDFKRILKGEFDYSRFRHWTDHDPLNIPWTSTDRDPGTDYMLTHSFTKSKLSYVPIGLPNLTLNVSYNEENRSGSRQVLSVLDSFSEILSDGKPTDEVTRDYEANVTYRQGLLTLSNSFWYRKFEDKASENVLVDGTRPFALVPEFDRYQNTLSAKVDNLPLNTGFYTNYTYYKVDSTESKSRFRKEAEIDYNSFLARLTSIPVTNLTMGLAYRYQKVENDVRKWYDASLPSVLDRDINTFTFDSVLRVIRSTTLRYEFEWEGIEREDGGLEQVHPIDTVRRSHRIAIQSRIPIFDKKARIKVEYRRDDVDDPFANIRLWNSARELDEFFPQLSANPTESDRVRIKFSVPIVTGLDLSLDGEWGDQEFKSGDGGSASRWKNEYIEPSVTLSYTPVANITTYLSYAYSKKRTETPFATELPNEFFTNETKYKEDANIWTAGISYQPMPALSLSGYFTYALQKAKYDSTDLGGELSNAGKWSEHDIKTSEISLSGDYRVSKKLSVNAQFIYERFDNDSIYLYDMSGDGYIGFVSLRWNFISL